MACLNALHMAVPPARAQVLADRLVTLLGGAVVTVDAGPPGATIRRGFAVGAPGLPSWVDSGPVPAATRNTDVPADPAPKCAPGAVPKTAPVAAPNPTPAAGPSPALPVSGSGVHDVHALPPIAAGPDRAVRPALVRSVLVDGDRVTVLSAWREQAFDARHVTLLRLLHPQIIWSFGPAVTPAGLPTGTAVVLDLMLGGLPEKEIARRLNRSAHTVHAHIKRVYRHYDVRSRPELMARLYEAQRGDPETT